MKKLIVVAFVGLMACSQTKKAEERSMDKITEADVYELIDSWKNAMFDGDREALDQVLDEQWLYAGGSDGTTADKKQALADFGKDDGSTKMLALNISKAVVRTYDDIAIITAVEEFVSVNVKTQDTLKSYLRFTDVYQKKNGKVVALTTHSSPIDKNDPEDKPVADE